jgi:hypothetical protein
VLHAMILIGRKHETREPKQARRSSRTHSVGTVSSRVNNVTPNDGRQARAVIQPAKDHHTHFHWQLKP